MVGMRDQVHRKARGAFFTPTAISRYLADWAIQSATDTVLEPSCGEASFLLAAARKLESLPDRPLFAFNQLHGVEIHRESANAAQALLAADGYSAEIEVCDFFEYSSNERYSAVIGNPPFVRYQNFSGAARTRSLEAALAQGVRLSGLASSWAAFVVKAAYHVAVDGRLALVLPAELLSVGYAAEVRRFLLSRFSRVRLIMFEERVFPEVLEEVVLLLAEGSGGAQCFEVYHTKDAQSLQAVELAAWTRHIPGKDEKWTPALLAHSAFATYRDLATTLFEEMSLWGGAYLGAVTGNNSFFSLTADQAGELGLVETDLVRISPPGSRHMRGLALTEAAWRQLARNGGRCYLLRPQSDPSPAARRYFEKGERDGVASTYKCRVRSPWWRVPLVTTPDLFLTYMNHDRPRLVTNSVRAHILNSVYGIRLREGRRSIGRDLLPVASLNSVTLLGAEIVGRAYGGGLLKMEPREADKLPLPSLAKVQEVERELRNVKPQLAQALRQGNLAAAVGKVDAILLAEVPEADLKALRMAREMLFERRRARGKSGEGRRSS
ncbi:MAG: SAM-dependent methyltransferase [Mesorhizobium sp.]|uniref:N-6 DNA methylase n=1 Tax=Mesorhizobium sp. TaxID=1871066 RepID=UPI0011F44902|nr:N-6 DNA methylase [Mesorhizobium sp.]TIP06720.1 MAG: SAM-dependent methyltransferase [Mesorhizobium sp.]TIP38761.1 MAG: SAM-dependent methyltransferase [Mesorhizobium sp.]TJV73125.1 MAG: SAM-dependent methyltransferase [Mesorhizobium sp.]